ncbi:MAG: glycosyltransferase family 61 protein, partial [Sphingobacteriaceae bacterium]
IYISRADRRRISNEDELVIMLKKFNFVIIEDKKRSVTEQITIYHNASFVLGPHGASFSNIIWCTPGTHLFELFSPNYTPDFFLYLANVMDLKYSAFYEGVPNSNINYFDGLVEDIYIPVAKLEACLEDIFNRDSAVEPADVNYAGEYNKV